MKSKKEHVEDWLPVLPQFNDEQLRKLYFLMEDYARDYHESKVNESRLGNIKNLNNTPVCNSCGFPMFNNVDNKPMCCHGCKNEKEV